MRLARRSLVIAGCFTTVICVGIIYSVVFIDDDFYVHFGGYGVKNMRLYSRVCEIRWIKATKQCAGCCLLLVKTEVCEKPKLSLSKWHCCRRWCHQNPTCSQKCSHPCSRRCHPSPFFTVSLSAQFSGHYHGNALESNFRRDKRFCCYLHVDVLPPAARIQWPAINTKITPTL